MPFSDTVDEPGRYQPLDAGSEGEDRFGEGCQSIADDRKELPATSQSDTAPENTFVMDAVASATPSMKPTVRADVPNTVTR